MDFGTEAPKPEVSPPQMSLADFGYASLYIKSDNRYNAFDPEQFLKMLKKSQLYMIWLFQLAPKCFLSIFECVNIDVGWGIAPDPLRK